MKTHYIKPNDVRKEIANFTIEYRYKKIPALDGGPSCQRFMRLTEIPEIESPNVSSRRTVWHEIYSEDIATNRNFTKWIKQRGNCFHWKGNTRDLYGLTFILSGK